MYLVRETRVFADQVSTEGARLHFLRDQLERRLYPRLEENPQAEGWYGRHQGCWYTRLEIASPLLVIQVSYTVDETNRRVQMETFHVVEYKPSD